jgi:hypothetical protein
MGGTSEAYVGRVLLQVLTRLCVGYCEYHKFSDLSRTMQKHLDIL